MQRPRHGPAPLISLGCALLAWGVGSQDVSAETLPASSRDGLYVTAGPLGGGTRIEGEWTSGIGLEVSVVSLREQQLPALLGVCGGWYSYTEQPGGRIWLEAEAALGRPVPIGLGVGAVAEVDRIRPPRFGVQATLWVMAGVVPYVRVGTLQERGGFLEVGLMIKLPLPRVVAW